MHLSKQFYVACLWLSLLEILYAQSILSCQEGLLQHDLDGDGQLSRTEFDGMVDTMAIKYYNGCTISRTDNLWKQTACACTHSRPHSFHECVCEPSATIATPAMRTAHYYYYTSSICHWIFKSLQRDCSSFGKETNPVKRLSAAYIMRRTQQEDSTRSTILLSTILPIAIFAIILSGALLFIHRKRRIAENNKLSKTNVQDTIKKTVATETTKVGDLNDEAYLTHSSSSSSQPPESASKLKVKIQAESIDELANAMKPLKFRSRSLGDFRFKKISSRETCTTEGSVDDEQGGIEALKMIYRKWLPSFEQKSDDNSLVRSNAPQEKNDPTMKKPSQDPNGDPLQETEAGRNTTLNKSCAASDRPDDLESEWCETLEKRSLVSKWSQSYDQHLEEQSLADRSRIRLGYDEESQGCGNCRTRSLVEQNSQSSSPAHRVHTLLSDSSFLDQSLVTVEDGYDDRSEGCETKNSTNRTRTWRFCPACGNYVEDLMNDLMDTSHESHADDDVSLEILQSQEFSVRAVKPPKK